MRQKYARGPFFARSLFSKFKCLTCVRQKSNMTCMNRQDIIKAIDAYALASGLKPSSICQYALRNRLFYDRLKGEGPVSMSSAERIVIWMEQNPPSAQQVAS